MHRDGGRQPDEFQYASETAHGVPRSGRARGFEAVQRQWERTL